jgi:nucleotide-binding universal stress UspA family protein
MSEYKILIPLDGSRLAEHSLAYLEGLRHLGEMRLFLLSVVDQTEDFHSLSPIEAQERETNLLSTYLREVSSDITKHVGVTVATKVVTGVPAACVMSEAQEYRPDLLVISTHGRSGTSRWRFGSVADKVIRGVSTNTLVVGPRTTSKERWLDTEAVAPFTSILVPLDGSRLAEQALQVAQKFAETFASTLHLVRTVPVPTLVDGYPGEAAYFPNLLGELEEGAAAYLSDVAARFSPELSVKTTVVVGVPAPRLEEYAEANGIDLVIMTTHGRGGLLRTALGSVTDRLLAGGVAPVLVVRPEGSGH